MRGQPRGCKGMMGNSTSGLLFFFSPLFQQKFVLCEKQHKTVEGFAQCFRFDNFAVRVELPHEEPGVAEPTAESSTAPQLSQNTISDSKLAS